MSPKPYRPNDTWSRKAAKEGFRARSVYKLSQIDEKYSIIKQEKIIVDLGACPGSWLQYVARKTKGRSKIIGIDLQEIEPIEHVSLYQADITDLDAMKAIFEKEEVQTIDVLISDLAPKTSGIKDVDQWRSIELSQSVLDVADEFVSPRGMIVIKVFRGADFDEFLAETKERYSKVHIAHAKASRDRSRELYMIIQK